VKRKRTLLIITGPRAAFAVGILNVACLISEIGRGGCKGSAGGSGPAPRNRIAEATRCDPPKKKKKT
jgi:hypothetical protein